MGQSIINLQHVREVNKKPTMLSLWTLYLLFLSLLLPHHAVTVKGKYVQEAPQNPAETTQGTHTANGIPTHPNIGPDTADSVGLSLSWPVASAEDMDRQGVIGEYGDAQDSSELSLLYGEKWLVTFSPIEHATELVSSRINVRPSSGLLPLQTTLEQKPADGPTESSTWETDSFSLSPTQAREKHQNKTTHFQLPTFISGLRPTYSPVTIATSPLSGVIPEHLTPSRPNNKWGWTVDPLATTQSGSQEESGIMANNGDGLRDINFHTETEKGDNGQSSVTSGIVSSHSCSPTNPDHVTSSEPPQPSLALGPSLSVPLYSDWNSALATWGLAWEAHVYGLGSAFTVLGLISAMCLLGLPLRCPPGSPYLTLLHIALLGFCGLRAFSLLYDAYSHQDRLPPLGSLLLSQLPLPCLTVAFSLAFLLLSLRSQVHLSPPLSISGTFSTLLRPGLLLCLSLLHLGVFLGCVGLLHLLHTLPHLILLLFPQGLFVFLSVFLSFCYVVFYCFIQADTRHAYRLNDSGEAGGSPGAMLRPARCPFADAADWRRAAAAGVGASLCLLGCGGLQLYHVLQAVGLGGGSAYGLQPWPWWAYHLGCRLCEAGLCVSLLLIGCQPVFCQASALRNKARPRPGSWSRLSCGSPSADLIMVSPEKGTSPVLPPHPRWSLDKQKKVMVFGIIPKGQTEVLPLCSIVDPPQNGLDGTSHKCSTGTKFLTVPSKSKGGRSQMSSLDSLGLDSDSTMDLRPPSPIDLSRSIDQALFSESLFSHSLFDPPRLIQTSSRLSLSSPSHGTSGHCRSSAETALYRTSSCGDVDQENPLSQSSQPGGALLCYSRPSPSPKQWGCNRGNSGSLSQASLIGSSQDLCCSPLEMGKMRSHSWANKGPNFAPSSLPRAIPHLPYHRHYRTLSLASQDRRGSGRLAGTKHLSESKQLERELAVQAEFMNVCKQIDALSVCSDTIEL